MIISLICTPLFLIVSAIISVIPSEWLMIGDAPTTLFTMLYTAFQFFPTDVWILVLGSITFWITVHFIYGVINFVLRLIPLLNMGQ